MTRHALHVLLVLLGALCVTSASHAAQPDIEPLIAEIAALERRAGDILLPIDEREQAADRAIERRRALIDAPGEDPRRISWLIDQASAVLARLARDASDTAVLVGVPTDAQHAEARRSAEVAAALLDRAGEAARGVTEEQTRLSLREGEAGNVLLAALRDEQVRGAFVRGRARALLAATSEGGERRSHAQQSIDALGGIGMDDPPAEAARRANLGLALLLRAEEGDARGAMSNLDYVAGESRTGRAGALPGTVAEALLARLHGAGATEFDGAVRDLAKTRDRPPRTTRGRPDPLWHLLFADAAARATIERWRRSPSAPLLRQAFDAHRRFLEHDPPIGLEGEALRSAVWARMDALVRLIGDAPAADLPPITVLAHAVALAREPAGRAEARRLLEDLARRDDAGPIRADAAWETGVIAADSGDTAGALEITARFAREFPSDPRADDAIAFALHHARERFTGAPETERGAARRAYLDALRVATSSFAHSPHIDRWRLERARLLLEPSADEDRAAGLALLEAIPPESALAGEADAIYERLQGQTLDDLRARLYAARNAGENEDARRLAQQMGADARRAAAWAGSRARPSLDRFLADRAEAQVESGKPDDAAGLCRDLLARGSRVPGGETRLRLTLGRALLLAGDEAGAFSALRDLVTPYDGAGADAARPEEYWHAWTLMLEVLAAEKGRAGAARVQVKRLESIDPALGGEPWRTRLRALVEGP